MIVNPRSTVLEPATQAFLAKTAALPQLDSVEPAVGRRIVDGWQHQPAVVSDVWFTVASAAGRVPLRIVLPPNLGGRLPVLIYVHGGGWVFGGARSHDRLVGELAAHTGAAVVFPEYALAPEARYPVALNQICAVARWVFAQGARHGLDTTRVAVGGDGVGATMAIALTLNCLRHRDMTVRQFIGFCPITDASCDTESHRTFSRGYHLHSTTMRWCWDQYAPDGVNRSHPAVSPLHTSMDELARFPASLIVTAEADVVRDEGEAFAAKLFAAGAPTTAVRYGSVIHGFVVLDALCRSSPARAAMAQATSALTTAFGS